MQTTLQALTQIEAMQAWPEAERFLQEAVTDDDPVGYMNRTQAFVFSGMHWLWRLVDEEGNSVAYAVVNVYSNDGIHSIAQMYLATSKDLEALLKHKDEFIAWAIKAKISYMEIIGRKGWERALRPLGFTHNHTSLLLRIDQELH